MEIEITDPEIIDLTLADENDFPKSQSGKKKAL